MMRLQVVGDTHNNAAWFHYLITQGAGSVDQIVQVGDFGFIFPQPNRENVLRKLEKVLARADTQLLFLPGNHEDHDALAEIEATAERNADGHFVVSEHIAYTGRVSSWEWEGRRLAAVGGAVSIDRDYRLALERQNGTKIWWAAEQLSPEEFAAARGMEPVDILFTHDAPSALPMLGLKPDLDSTAYRQQMTDVGRALCPRLWFHGHYHRDVRYEFHHRGGVCQVRGLDCDGVHNNAKSTAVLCLPWLD